MIVPSAVTADRLTFVYWTKVGTRFWPDGHEKSPGPGGWAVSDPFTWPFWPEVTARSH